MLFRKITSKLAGGRGNPPLQQGAESTPPTLALQFARFGIHSKSCGGSKPPPYSENFIPLNTPTNPNLYFKFIPHAYRKKPPKRRLLV